MKRLFLILLAFLGLMCSGSVVTDGFHKDGIERNDYEGGISATTYSNKPEDQLK